MDNYILLLGLLLVFMIYYKSTENFENDKEDMTKNKECSRLSLSKAIYGYNVNMINRGAR
jgi:hypothetical protein